MHFVNKILHPFGLIILTYQNFKKRKNEIEKRKNEIEKLKNEIEKLKKERTKLYNDRTNLRNEKNTNANICNMVTEMAISPIDALFKYFVYMPNNQMVAFSFARDEATRILGFSLLASRAAKQGLFPVANAYLTNVPISFMIKHDPLITAEILSREDVGRFSAFVDTILQTHPDISCEALAETCYSLLYLQDKPRAESLYNEYKYFITTCDDKEKYFFAGLQAYFQRSDRPIKKQTSENEINIGLLGYHLASRLISTNIGDYFQTMGMVGNILASGMRPNEDSMEECGFLHDLAGRFPVTGKEREVSFHVFSRDDLSLSPTAAPVWLPVFGWMAHPKFRRSFEFDLPENIKPLFISFHLANADLLTLKNVETLKKYAPIGCRDYTTVRILRSAGIPAFFSGCISSTLDLLYKRENAGDDSFAVSHLEKNIFPKQHETYICQTIPDLLYMDFCSCMQKADELLSMYVRAKNIRTSLLHCIMPCRSIGIPCSFTHKKPGDRRFEGLIDAHQDDIDKMKIRLGTILRGVFDAILEGQDEKKVYAKWCELCEPEMINTTDYLNECSQKYAINVDVDVDSILANIPKETFGATYPKTEIIHVCFAIDNNYIHHFRTTALSLLNKSSQPIHIHVLTRNVISKKILSLLEHTQCANLTQYDCSMMRYESMKLLPHTTLSTMDRLMIPELLHGIDKAIYLDTDILVRKDIRELWAVPLADKLLAARSSIHKEWHRGVTLSLEVAERYNAETAKAIRTHLYDTGPVDFLCFNAGVLSMNLKKMRMQSITAYTMTLAKEFRMHDQFCLNIAARNDVTWLPAEWNHFYSQEIMEDPAIVHYIGPWKPWDYQQLPYSDEWNSYKTIFEND
jgi:lipopolysaccharide biosynthesis glycosyltransferase